MRHAVWLAMLLKPPRRCSCLKPCRAAAMAVKGRVPSSRPAALARLWQAHGVVVRCEEEQQSHLKVVRLEVGMYGFDVPTCRGCCYAKCVTRIHTCVLAWMHVCAECNAATSPDDMVVVRQHDLDCATTKVGLVLLQQGQQAATHHQCTQTCMAQATKAHVWHARCCVHHYNVTATARSRQTGLLYRRTCLSTSFSSR